MFIGSQEDRRFLKHLHDILPPLDILIDDGGHTMNEANPNAGFFDLYTIITGGEQMPPHYFYSLYFIFKIFGYHTIVARLYSAIIAIVSIYAIYLLGKEMFSKKTGLIAAIILCVNPSCFI